MFPFLFAIVNIGIQLIKKLFLRFPYGKSALRDILIRILSSEKERIASETALLTRRGGNDVVGSGHVAVLAGRLVGSIQNVQLELVARRVTHF